MGGPAEMAFGWPLVAVFTMTVALSMAELASAVPTSGAMYHWACQLGGNAWGWFTAWFNIAGQLAAIAGIDYGAALFVTPLVGLPMTTTNILTVYAGILLSHAVMNHVGIRLVARLNDLSVAGPGGGRLPPPRAPRGPPPPPAPPPALPPPPS